MNPAKSLLAASVVASVAPAPAAAIADDKAACVDASLEAQQLRRDHQLLEARDQLRICAAASCPGAVQGDCATWLGEVEKTMPTVVPSAKSGAGLDLVDVKVSVDGRPLVSRLDGQAYARTARSPAASCSQAVWPWYSSRRAVDTRRRLRQ